MKREIRFKRMPNGNIRAYQSDSEDKAGVSEWMLTATYNIADTITVAHIPKIYFKIEL